MDLSDSRVESSHLVAPLYKAPVDLPQVVDILRLQSISLVETLCKRKWKGPPLVTYDNFMFSTLLMTALSNFAVDKERRAATDALETLVLSIG